MPHVNFNMAECRALNLVKKPNTKSSIWTYLGLEADESDKPLPDKEDSPVCRACKNSVLAKGGITSNLLTHLRDHYPDLYFNLSYLYYVHFYYISSLYCINVIYEL